MDRRAIVTNPYVAQALEDELAEQEVEPQEQTLAQLQDRFDAWVPGGVMVGDSDDDDDDVSQFARVVRPDSTSSAETQSHATAKPMAAKKSAAKGGQQVKSEPKSQPPQAELLGTMPKARPKLTVTVPKTKLMKSAKAPMPLPPAKAPSSSSGSMMSMHPEMVRAELAKEAPEVEPQESEEEEQEEQAQVEREMSPATETSDLESASPGPEEEAHKGEEDELADYEGVEEELQGVKAECVEEEMEGDNAAGVTVVKEEQMDNSPPNEPIEPQDQREGTQIVSVWVETLAIGITPEIMDSIQGRVQMRGTCLTHMTYGDEVWFMMSTENQAEKVRERTNSVMIMQSTVKLRSHDHHDVHCLPFPALADGGRTGTETEAEAEVKQNESRSQRRNTNTRVSPFQFIERYNTIRVLQFPNKCL
jgi:hypothetical protein